MENKAQQPRGKRELRKLLGNIAIALTLAFTAYLSVIMLHRISTVVLSSTYVQIFIYELAVMAIFLILSLDLRFGFFTKSRRLALRILGWIPRGILLAVGAAVLFFGAKITFGSVLRSSDTADYAIVLGLALENGKPQDDLLSRLDVAVEYLGENPEATLILTGGNPDENGMTEAAVMRELLLERGVPDEKMILEDRAATTKENFKNTAQLLDPADPVVLISSNYHMDRAVNTAKSAGFSDIVRLPAPSSLPKLGANIMWEIILEINEFTLRK